MKVHPTRERNTDGYGMGKDEVRRMPPSIPKIKLKIKSTSSVTIPVTRQWHQGQEYRRGTSFMRLAKLKLAAVAVISLLGLSFQAAPAAAGGCWYDRCGSAVVVQPVPYVYPSCSCCGCGGASYGLGYYGGYGGGPYGGVGYYGGYGAGLYGAGYGGGLYGRGYYGGYRGGLYGRASLGGYRGGYRRGYGYRAGWRVR